MDKFERFQNFYLEEIRPLRLEDQKAPYVKQIFPNDSCDEIIELPSGSGTPITFNDELWYFYRKTLLPPTSNNKNSGPEIFGICEIDKENGYDLKDYPIPVVHPPDSSEESERRYFCFRTKSGNDLIHVLTGPPMPDKKTKPHFIYGFDSVEKEWFHILSVMEDGSYEKKTIPRNSEVGKYSSESIGNAYTISPGELYVWSVGDGKIRVEESETCVSPHPIGHRQPETEKYWEKIAISNKDINNEKYLFGGLARRSVLLQKVLGQDFRTEYRIVGLLSYIDRKDPFVKTLPGGTVDYRHNGSVLFDHNSAKKLGVFMGYSNRYPDKTDFLDKGSMFILDAENTE